MRKSALVLLACMIFLLAANHGYGQCCNYQIALYDTYGDGWNGGFVTVYVSGVPVLSNITLASGAGPQLHQIPINPGDVISTTFTAGGWIIEPYYRILNCEGNIVATDGPSATGPAGLSGIIAVCTSAQSIPTLSEWGLIILTMLLGASAIMVLRKQRSKMVSG
jgi:hypothetical protein